MKQGFAEYKDSKAVASTCKEGQDALLQSAQALGCNMTPSEPAKKPGKAKKKRAAK